MTDANEYSRLDRSPAGMVDDEMNDEHEPDDDSPLAPRFLNWFKCTGRKLRRTTEELKEPADALFEFWELRIVRVAASAAWTIIGSVATVIASKICHFPLLSPTSCATWSAIQSPPLILRIRRLLNTKLRGP